MNLIPDWKPVLTKAWSMRFIVLAAALGGVEVFLPNFADVLPPKSFALLSFAVTCLAGLARLIAQPEMRDGDK